MHCPQHNGYSLIELIIVIVVLSIAGAAFATMFVQLPRSLVLDEDVQTASQLAQARAEEILSDRRHPLGPGFATIVDANYPDETPVAGFPYRRRVRITDLVTPPCPVAVAGVCKQVVVTVDRGGAPTLAEVTFLVLVYN
jgi:prepilin-type N-terminal cleavage/methylation domain-containing protein